MERARTRVAKVGGRVEPPEDRHQSALAVGRGRMNGLVDLRSTSGFLRREP